MAGTIYLVATPLGNLEDITLRALRILREVDLIACEDTRRTRQLLSHFDISKRLLSYHEHNEIVRAVELVRRAKQGKNIAVVSDAGMPTIADPGYRIVNESITAGVTVVPIPGPIAAATALAASGLPTDAFHFVGFLPAKRAQRRKTLQAVAHSTATLVFYETPHRIIETLADVVAVLGDRPAVVARELTKIHEEFLRGAASKVLGELRSRETVKGEITLLIGHSKVKPEITQTAQQRVAELTQEQGLAKMDAIKRAARERGISKRQAYQLLEQCKKHPPTK